MAEFVKTKSMPANSQTQSRLRRVSMLVGRDPATLLGALMIALIVAAALLAPLLAPYDPERQHLADAFDAPSARYPFGTDHLGRDTLSRLLYGGRATLGAASVVLAVVLVIAVTVGTLAGYWGGWVDAVLMRVVDVVLAFPGLLLAVAVAGTLGTGLLYVTLAMATTWWAGYARIIRGVVLAARRQEYITAARVLGLSTPRIIVRHILPNIVGPLLVLASLDFGLIILSIAGLNFLGLGVQPPLPEWGAMLNDAQPFLQTDPQLVAYPAAMIFVTVLGCNLLGDGLRDWLDPQTRGR